MPGDGGGSGHADDRHAETRPLRLYRRAVVVFSVVIAAIGAALLVVTAARGGGTVGFLVGGLFVALGVARFTLERKRGPL